ncbi:MAG: hypothetical protein IJJ22_04195 [Oscillospiraceae bacterium]|nr:hypothetical protein [Oscillospiraceae bacterium]
MDIDKKQNELMESYGEHFRSSLQKAAEACDIALTDILSARADDGKVDTKTLKELASTLKDLNGLGGDQSREPLRVLFSSEAERFGV